MIGIVWNNAIGEGDLATNDDGSLADGDPMLTSACKSLFTDARVEPSEGVALPDRPQGWWGTKYLQHVRGSRLWTLARAKLNTETLALAQIYAYEALAWWLRVGVATQLITEATFRDSEGINLRVEAVKPDGSRWEHVWEGRLANL